MCDHLWASPKLSVMIYWDWKARAMIGNICQSSKRFYRPRPNFLSSNRSVKRLCKKQAVAIGGNHHRGGQLPSLYRYWTSLLFCSFVFLCICICNWFCICNPHCGGQLPALYRCWTSLLFCSFNALHNSWCASKRFLFWSEVKKTNSVRFWDDFFYVQWWVLTIWPYAQPVWKGR